MYSCRESPNTSCIIFGDPVEPLRTLTLISTRVHFGRSACRPTDVCRWRGWHKAYPPDEFYLRQLSPKLLHKMPREYICTCMCPCQYFMRIARLSCLPIFVLWSVRRICFIFRNNVVALTKKIRRIEMAALRLRERERESLTMIRGLRIRTRSVFTANWLGNLYQSTMPSLPC